MDTIITITVRNIGITVTTATDTIVTDIMDTGIRNIIIEFPEFS